VEDVALAVCDARTATRPEASLEVVNVLSGYTRRNKYLKYSEDLRFYYLSRMTDDEVCAFVVFDSSDEYSKYSLQTKGRDGTNNKSKNSAHIAHSGYIIWRRTLSEGRGKVLKHEWWS